MPPFSGKKEDFAMWVMKFTAIATMVGFGSAIETTAEDGLPKSEERYKDLDPKKDDDKPKIAAWKRNAQAFSELTLALPNKLYRILVKADGKAYKVMQQLYEDYRPRDNISLVEAEQRFDRIVMKDMIQIVVDECTTSRQRRH